MSLLKELKRRNVLRVAVAYLAAAWFLIEVADTIFPRFGFNDIAVTNTIVLLAIGFIPTLIISWFFELTPEGFKRDADVAPEKSIAPRTGKMLDRLIIVMLVLAVGFFAVDKFILDPERDTLKIRAATEKGRNDAILGSYGDKSIAVLAFSDMSPAHDQEYFSDGIAEELLNLLATIKELRVISRSSAFSFKGSDATLQEIGEKLNVVYILEGSVRKAGDKIRITAQLIDARTDTHIWSQTYDRTLDDVFAIQDEISERIVEHLKLTLFGDIPTTTKIDPLAYEKYLKARYIVHSFTGNVSELREAQVLFDEILTVEPNYIPALNDLARVYYRIPKFKGLSVQQNKAEIQALADRVIAIDPNGVDALIWQGWFAYRRNNLQSAARYYEQAMSIDSNNVDLQRVVGLFLMRIGRPEESIALGNHLLLRDPSCVACINNLAYVYRLSGRYKEAALVLGNKLKWDAQPEGLFWLIGLNWLLADLPEKALAAFEKELSENERKIGIILALHDLGRTDEFTDQFSRLRNDSENAEAIARVYAWVGSNDKAFEWLDQMIALDGPERLSGIDRQSIYTKIKPDPRWRTLLEQYGYYEKPHTAVEFQFTLPLGMSTE